MKTRTVLFVMILIMLPALSQAQIGGMLRKATSKVAGSIGKAATKEAANEIDSAAMKNAAQTENPDQSGQANQEGSGGKGMNLGGLFSGGPVTSKYNENYSFTSRMYMVMEVYDKKEVTKMDYNLYFSSSNPNAGMEIKTIAKPEEGDAVPVTAQVILDGENKSFMMLTDMGSMKMGVISPLPDQAATQGQVDPKTGQPVKPPVITKTGNSKVIAGYKCDEYLYKEEDAKESAKVWMTKEQVFNADKRIWSNTNMASLYSVPGFEGMTALAWESYDEKNVLIAKAETVEINKNYPHSMTTKGFSLRQMDFNKMMQNQNQNQKK